jgi:hypothetical protein
VIGRRILFIACLFVVGGCEGVSPSIGNEEPMRVRNAQLFSGPLPGLAPDDPTPSEGPTVTSIDLQNAIVYNAASDKRIAGHVDDTAVAVGLMVPTLSDSHWVLPLGGADPQFPGELSFVTSASFDARIPPGLHPLRVVAITADGEGGRQRDVTLCFRPPFDDNLNSCNPTNPPPATVVSLHWDRDADLDLEIVTPSGRRVTPRRPRVSPEDPSSPFIDRDSLKGCIPDGMRRESIVFNERPSGRWEFYARMFESCGFEGVRFTLEIYERQSTDGVLSLVRTLEIDGRMISRYDAAGDIGEGLFLTDIEF